LRAQHFDGHSARDRLDGPVSPVRAKLVVLAPPVEFAWPSVPRLPPSSGLVTGKVDGTLRSSSISRARQARRGT